MDVTCVTKPMAKQRIQIPNLGEHYSDLLKIEAWIKDRSMPNEAQSLLCSTLMRREATRNTILERLAAKRGISVEQLTQSILTDKEEHLAPEEYADLLAEQIEAST